MSAIALTKVPADAWTNLACNSLTTGNLNVDGTTTYEGPVVFNDPVTCNATLTCNSSVQLNGTNTTTGASTFGGTVDFNSTTTFNDAATFENNLVANGPSIFSGGFVMTASQGLAAGGPVSFTITFADPNVSPRYRVGLPAIVSIAAGAAVDCTVSIGILNSQSAVFCQMQAQNLAESKLICTPQTCTIGAVVFRVSNPTALAIAVAGTLLVDLLVIT